MYLCVCVYVCMFKFSHLLCSGVTVKCDSKCLNTLSSVFKHHKMKRQNIETRSNELLVNHVLGSKTANELQRKLSLNIPQTLHPPAPSSLAAVQTSAETQGAQSSGVLAR